MHILLCKYKHYVLGYTVHDKNTLNMFLYNYKKKAIRTKNSLRPMQSCRKLFAKMELITVSCILYTFVIVLCIRDYILIHILCY
jgi:hypothetical protein